MCLSINLLKEVKLTVEEFSKLNNSCKISRQLQAFFSALIFDQNDKWDYDKAGVAEPGR